MIDFSLAPVRATRVSGGGGLEPSMTPMFFATSDQPNWYQPLWNYPSIPWKAAHTTGVLKRLTIKWHWAEKLGFLQIKLYVNWSCKKLLHWDNREFPPTRRGGGGRGDNCHFRLPQHWFGTLTWPPFHCFGTPIWRMRRQSSENTLFSWYCSLRSEVILITLNRGKLWIVDRCI